MFVLPSISINKKSETSFDSYQKNERYLLANTSPRGSHILLDPLQVKLDKITSQKLGKLGISFNQNRGLKEQVVEKVWLIRKIGDMLQEDTRVINDKRKKIKQSVSKNYKKYNRKADKLLNLIQQEANAADDKQIRVLRETLR